MWDAHRAHELMLGALRRESDRRAREQAHLGVDALSELALHPILRGALEPEWTVLAEQRFPGESRKRRRSEGERCDIVLLEPGDEPPHLIDPLSEDTLFGGRGVEPEEAVWIEVKSVGQHALFEDDFARPNPQYSSVLLQQVPRDVTKLSADPRIRRAGVLVVHFCAEARIAENDLHAMTEKLYEKAPSISAPILGSFEIPDHIGNAMCTLALIPVHHTV
jgi:hypothetical protein